MLTGIWNNGEMFSNPQQAGPNSVEVHQNAQGQFEVRADGVTLSTFVDLVEANEVAINVSRGLGCDSGETYEQRYRRTTEWSARHIAQDLMQMNGRDTQVSIDDEKRLAIAEQQDTIKRGEELMVATIGKMLTF